MPQVKGVFVARWVARGWSGLNILVVLLFVVSEIVGSGGKPPTTQEWVALALWPIGVAVGLIIAWYCEVVGAILALGCLVGFYIWDLLRSGRFPQGPFFLLFAAPAFVFLIAAFLSRRSLAAAP